MNPVRHALCNFKLTAPEGRTDVIDLPVWRGEVVMDSGPQHVVISFWRPTPEELQQLQAGACVALQCVGTTAPPVWIGVQP